MHGFKIPSETFAVGVAADLKFRTDGVVFEIRGQQPRGGRNTGIWWNDHLGYAQIAGYIHSVQRPGTAKGNQGKLPWVMAFLHGAGTDGICHVGVDNS